MSDKGAVRCICWRKCDATDDETANNWCDHWGEHEHGSAEDKCGSVCFGFRDPEGRPTLVRCKSEN